MGTQLYAPMAETTKGQTLFIDTKFNLMADAIRQIEIWDKEYNYDISRCWVDIYYDGALFKKVDFERQWLPKADSDIREPNPDWLGKSLRSILTEIRPTAVSKGFEGGVCGCPADYEFFGSAYNCSKYAAAFGCLRRDNCVSCWNQPYAGINRQEVLK